MQINNHKLVCDPNTFNWVLLEITYPPYTKREVDPAELRLWEYDRFKAEMDRCGYGGFVDSYIEQEQVEFLVR